MTNNIDGDNDVKIPQGKGVDLKRLVISLKEYIADEKYVSNAFREKAKTETKNREHEKYYHGEVMAMQLIEKWIKKQGV